MVLKSSIESRVLGPAAVRHGRDGNGSQHLMGSKRHKYRLRPFSYRWSRDFPAPGCGLSSYAVVPMQSDVESATRMDGNRILS